MMKMSSLRVTAEFDASAYVRGMEAKVAADRAAAASSGQVDAAVERTATEMTAAGRAIGTLSRQYVDGYGTAQKAEAAYLRLARAIEQDNDVLTRAGPIVEGIYRKHGQLADAVKLAESGHLGLARVVVDFNTKLAAEQEALDRTTAAVQRLANAQKAQQEINARLGVNDNFGGDSRGQDIAAYGAELDRLRAKFVPLAAAQQQYRSTLAEINDAARVGAISEQQRTAAIQRTKDAFAQQVRTINDAKQATEGHTGALRLQSHQWANLNQQILDVGVSLQGGQNPLTVLTQQGPQAVFAVGGLRNAMTLLAAAITPVTVAGGLAAVAVALIGARAIQVAGETREFNVAIQGAGRSAEVSAAQLRGLVEQMRAAGAAKDDATEGVLALTRTPRVNAQQIQQIGAIAPDAAAASGKSVADVMREMGQAAVDGYAGIKKLDEAFNFLTTTELAQIRAMVEHGDKAGALRLAFDKLGEQTKNLGREQLSPLGRIWTDLGRIYRGLVDAVLENPQVKSILEGVAGALGWVADAVERLAKGSAAANLGNLTQQIALLDGQIAQMRETAESQKTASPGRASALEENIARLERHRDALKAEVDRLGRAGAGTSPVQLAPIEVRGTNNDADAKAGRVFVDEQTEAFNRQVAAYKKLGDARTIALASARAEQEAIDRGITGADKEALVKLRVREATVQLSAAANDNAAQQDAEVLGAQRVAAAWQLGAGAAHDAEIAAQAHAQTLNKVGQSEDAVRAKLQARAAAQQLASNGKVIDDLKQQVAAQERLTAAIGLSAEEQAEVARQNEVAAFSYQTLATITEKSSEKDRERARQQIAQFDELKKKQLEQTQLAERQKAVTEALTNAQVESAKAQVAAISDPALRRAGELEIERLQEMIRLTKLYKEGLNDPAAQKQLIAFDSIQASRETARFFSDVRQKAEGMASDVSQFLVDGFVNAGEGGKSMFENLWDGALQGAKRLVANIVAEFLKQQFILPITTQIVGSMPGLFGITGPQAPSNNFSLTKNDDGSFSITQAGSLAGTANTLSGGSLFGGLGLNNLLGSGTGFMGLPSLGTAFNTVGGALGIGSGVSSAVSAGGLGGAVYGIDAIAGPGAAAIATDAGALAAGGAAGLGASIASIALPVAAVLIPLLLSGIFKGKPSNLGAEYSFGLDDAFTPGFVSDKHPQQVAMVQSFAQPMQQLIIELEQRYGVGRRADATVGITTGKREGNAFYYDAGPRDGGIEGRQRFEFNPEDQGSIQAAFDKFAVAFLKDSDWSKLGDEAASGIANSTATSLDAFLKDVDFAKNFRSTVDFFNQGMDPVNSQLAQLKTNAEQFGNAAATQITGFLDKTKELWPSVTRSFDEAGSEIQASTREVTTTLSAAWQQSNSEAEGVGNQLQDASGHLYTFSGAIGDASLELTDAAGGVSTATLDAATGIYSLTTSVTELGSSVASTTTVLSQQQVDATTAAKNYALGLLGLNQSFRFVQENGVDVLKQGVFAVTPALSGMDLALEQSRQNIEGLRPALEATGATAEEIAILIPAAMARAADQVRATFANLATVTSAQSSAILNGKQYIPLSALELVGAAAPNNAAFNSTANGGGQGFAPAFFAEIDRLLGKARSGTLTGAEVAAFSTNINNQASYGRWNPGELNAIAQGVYNAFQAMNANKPAPSPEVPEYKPPTDTGSTGTGSTDSTKNDELRDKIQGQIDDYQKLQDVQQDAAREAERLSEAFKGAADDIRRYRLGREIDPSVSPLSLADQLTEAQRQQTAALARVLAGGPDAVDAMRELQDTTASVDELAKRVFGNSPQYNAIFTASTDKLRQAEEVAIGFEQQQLAALAVANAELKRIGDEIERLRGELGATNGGGSTGTPGGGETPGGGTPPVTTPPPTGAGQDLAFGYANLGRGQGETAQEFMLRVFPKAAKDLMKDGSITELEGYTWSQAQHPSGLGLTNSAYFTAARRAGFNGQFDGTLHQQFLSPGGIPDAERWGKFIAELGKFATVPANYFGAGLPATAVGGSGWTAPAPGTPKQYATGGLVTGGTPGVDSVAAMLMPGEYVMPADRVRALGVGQLDAWRAGMGVANDNLAASATPIVSAIDRGIEVLVRELRMVRADLAEVKIMLGQGNANTAGIRDDAAGRRAAQAPAVGRAGGRKAA